MASNGRPISKIPKFVAFPSSPRSTGSSQSRANTSRPEGNQGMVENEPDMRNYLKICTISETDLLEDSKKLPEALRDSVDKEFALLAPETVDKDLTPSPSYTSLIKRQLSNPHAKPVDQSCLAFDQNQDMQVANPPTNSILRAAEAIFGEISEAAAEKAVSSWEYKINTNKLEDIVDEIRNQDISDKHEQREADEAHWKRTPAEDYKSTSLKVIHLPTTENESDSDDDKEVINVARGPGDNGDGRGVHSPLAISKTKVSPSPRASIQLDQQDTDVANVLNANQHALEKVVSEIVDKRISEIINRTSSTDDVGMHKGFLQKALPNPFLVEDNAKCEIYLPKTLILHDNQSDLHSKSKVIPIRNATSSFYAFKVSCQGSNISASPDIGLLRPSSSVFITFRAIVGMRQDRIGIEDKIAISVFPASEADINPNKINSRYQYLSEQCPKLIETEHVDRIIMWSEANLLAEKFDFFNCIRDKTELASIKEAIHAGQRVEYNRVEELAQLKSIKKHVVVCSSHLKYTCHEISSCRNVQKLILSLMVLLMGYVLITSLLFSVEEPQPRVPESLYDSIMNVFF